MNEDQELLVALGVAAVVIICFVSCFIGNKQLRFIVGLGLFVTAALWIKGSTDRIHRENFEAKLRSEEIEGERRRKAIDEMDPQVKGAPSIAEVEQTKREAYALFLNTPRWKLHGNVVGHLGYGEVVVRGNATKPGGNASGYFSVMAAESQKADRIPIGTIVECYGWLDGGKGKFEGDPMQGMIEAPVGK